MAIEVTCPRGHVLKVKDKYAGKIGCCPHCNSRVQVPELSTISDEDILGFVGPVDPPAPEPEVSANVADSDDEHVYQDPKESDSSSGMSLLNSSAIRHSKTCRNCGEKAPLWHASCPRCDCFFEA